MNIAYIRVSTLEQNEDRQVQALSEKWKIDKFFIDKCSGKDTNRPKLTELLDYVRKGDRVIIHEFSRLARNTQDLLNLVQTFKDKHVTLISNKDNIDTSTPIGEFMLTVIGAINQLERQQIKERQLEGIKIAKEKGKFKGKQVKQIDNNTFIECYTMYLNREINKTQLAQKLNISRPTLNKLIIDKKNEGII